MAVWGHLQVGERAPREAPFADFEQIAGKGSPPGRDHSSIRLASAKGASRGARRRGARDAGHQLGNSHGRCATMPTWSHTQARELAPHEAPFFAKLDISGGGGVRATITPFIRKRGLMGG